MLLLVSSFMAGYGPVTFGFRASFLRSFSGTSAATASRFYDGFPLSLQGSSLSDLAKIACVSLRNVSFSSNFLPGFISLESGQGNPFDPVFLPPRSLSNHYKDIPVRSIHSRLLHSRFLVDTLFSSSSSIPGLSFGPFPRPLFIL